MLSIYIYIYIYLCFFTKGGEDKIDMGAHGWVTGNRSGGFFFWFLFWSCFKRDVFVFLV